MKKLVEVLALNPDSARNQWLNPFDKVEAEIRQLERSFELSQSSLKHRGFRMSEGRLSQTFGIVGILADFLVSFSIVDFYGFLLFFAQLGSLLLSYR